MSKKKDELAKRDDPSLEDAKAAQGAATDARKNEELDEGLEESFPGSDAPSSTRRSTKD